MAAAVARHPEAAAPDEGRGPPAPALRRGSATCRAPTPSRSSGAIAPDDDPTDYTYGVAITSSFHPDDDTHIEPVRYGKGFNTMAMLQTVLTDGDGDGPRWRAWLKEMWTAARQRRGPLRLQALVRAHRDRPGDAEPRQLDHDVRQAQPVRAAWRMTSRAGPRRPEPDLDPGRQRGRTPDRRARSAAPPAATSASRSACR